MSTVLKFGQDGAPLVKVFIPPKKQNLSLPTRRTKDLAKNLEIYNKKNNSSFQEQKQELQIEFQLSGVFDSRELRKRKKKLLQLERLIEKQKGSQFNTSRELQIKRRCKELCIPYNENVRPDIKIVPDQRKKVRSRPRQQTRVNQSENHYISRREKKEFALMLFHRMTTEEKMILPELRTLGFLPQKIVLGFIPDFWLPPKKIIVEIDGGYHSDPAQTVKDNERDVIFRRNGYKVLRFTNEQVSSDLKMVVEQIKKVVLV